MVAYCIKEKGLVYIYSCENVTRFFNHRSWLAIAVIGSTSPLFAGSYSGTAGFTFLELPTGARAAAMGNAFSSVPNDIEALPYNPASLATLIVSQVSFQHLNYINDVTEEGLAYGEAKRDNGISWGILANYLRVGNIDSTVATLQSTGDGFVQGDSFSTYDMLLGLGLAGPVADGFYVGGNLKMIRESLYDASSSGGIADAGLIYQGEGDRLWNAAAVVQNLGFAGRFSDAYVQLPWSLRLGLSGQPFAQWFVSGDFVKRQDSSGELDFGAEVTPVKIFSIRLGYRYEFTKQDYGSLSGFSTGFGIRWTKWSFEYAFVPLGDLGMTHSLTVNYRFKHDKPYLMN